LTICDQVIHGFGFDILLEVEPKPANDTECQYFEDQSYSNDLRLQRRTGLEQKGLVQMHDWFGRARATSSLLPVMIIATATSMIATSAVAQAPTQAQRNAIKSQCRSDYIAHCSSVPPGGAASLQCLQNNMASLAPGCQAAVNAVAAPSEAKTETQTVSKTESATTPPAESKTKSAAAPTAEPAANQTTNTSAKTMTSTVKKPSSAQIAAIRSACRSDYPRVCADVPPGGAQALRCLQKNTTDVSTACQNAVAAVAGGAAASAGSAPAQEAATSPAAPAAAPAAPSAAPPVIALRPMRPREVLFVMRSACGADVRTLCAGVDPGGGRILQCLVSNGASLSPDCRAVLSRFAAQ
jgi:hypothetical protein